VLDPKIKALELIYRADIAKYLAEIEDYVDNSFRIGKHGSVIDNMDQLVTKLAETENKLITLEKYYINE
jgi:hypothetical protein